MSISAQVIKSDLERLISNWSMLESKFYKAWSAGELPINALKAYANEYGAFICELPNGWLSQSDAETAEEEKEHIELWEKFAESLETKVGEAQISGVKNLLEVSKRLFSEPISAMGALYAFEVQQPETSVSKLEGLKKHYKLDKKSEAYFEVHSSNEHEAEKLLARIEKLTDSELKTAYAACEEMSKALRLALDALFDSCCSENCCH